MGWNGMKWNKLKDNNRIRWKQSGVNWDKIKWDKLGSI